MRVLTSVVEAATSVELRLEPVVDVAPVALVEPLVAPMVLLLCWSLLREVSVVATEPVPEVEPVALRDVSVELVPLIEPVPLVELVPAIEPLVL
jgi:hypothetical protein